MAFYDDPSYQGVPGQLGKTWEYMKPLGKQWWNNVSGNVDWATQNVLNPANKILWGSQTSQIPQLPKFAESAPAQQFQPLGRAGAPGGARQPFVDPEAAQGSEGGVSAATTPLGPPSFPHSPGPAGSEVFTGEPIPPRGSTPPGEAWAWNTQMAEGPRDELRPFPATDPYNVQHFTHLPVGPQTQPGMAPPPAVGGGGGGGGDSSAFGGQATEALNRFFGRDVGAMARQAMGDAMSQDRMGVDLARRQREQQLATGTLGQMGAMQQMGAFPQEMLLKRAEAVSNILPSVSDPAIRNALVQKMMQELGIAQPQQQQQTQVGPDGRPVQPQTQEQGGGPLMSAALGAAPFAAGAGLGKLGRMLPGRWGPIGNVVGNILGMVGTGAAESMIPFTRKTMEEHPGWATAGGLGGIGASMMKGKTPQQAQIEETAGVKTTPRLGEPGYGAEYGPTPTPMTTPTVAPPTTFPSHPSPIVPPVAPWEAPATTTTSTKATIGTKGQVPTGAGAMPQGPEAAPQPTASTTGQAGVKATPKAKAGKLPFDKKTQANLFLMGFSPDQIAAMTPDEAVAHLKTYLPGMAP